MARLIVRGSNLTWDGTGRGGQALMTLQWLEALRRLGHEVLHHEVLDDSPWIARQFGSILHDWWDPAAVAAVSADGRPLYGLDVARVEEFARDADACISLGANYSPDLEPWLAGIHPRILIEQD